MDESTSKLQQALLEHTTMIQKEALDSAAEHIRSQRKMLVNVKIFAICLTVLLVVAMVWEHEKMVDHVARIKTMLSMYRQ